MADPYSPSAYGSAVGDLYKAQESRTGDIQKGPGMQQQPEGAKPPGGGDSGGGGGGGGFSSPLGKLGSALGGAGGPIGEVLGAGLDTMMMFSAAAKKETEKRQKGLIDSVGGMQANMMRSAQHTASLGSYLKPIG